jgi:hypothetical protein
MSIFASPRFLPNVLLADAASCVLCGAAQLLATDLLSELLRLPSALLVGTGWFLVAYGVSVAFIAARRPLSIRMLPLLVAGNLAWAAACAALLASGWVAPSALGVAWVLAQAACVLVLADLQWLGLRHSRSAGLA